MITYSHFHNCDITSALPDIAFYMIHIQSPQHDNAMALAEFVLSECSCC